MSLSDYQRSAEPLVNLILSGAVTGASLQEQEEFNQSEPEEVDLVDTLQKAVSIMKGEALSPEDQEN